MICKKCQQDRTKGYYKNPKKKLDPKQFWCDSCFERSCMQENQDRHYRNIIDSKTRIVHDAD